MATPVVDLRRRLRAAGFTEDQADAVSGALELLGERVREIERRMERIEARMGRIELRLNVLIGLVTGLIVLMAAPYFGIAVEPGGGPRAVRPGSEHERLKRDPGSEHEGLKHGPGSEHEGARALRRRRVPPVATLHARRGADRPPLPFPPPRAGDRMMLNSFELGDQRAAPPWRPGPQR